MLIATAGHVDHGKTSLLQSLTGVNTDSLPEEKKRGMTIDIGFAYQPVQDRMLGFIDVPGHEKFLSNMLAGVAGIDLALLVVAADDGVMPQTREHWAILKLLGTERVIVALTKSDLASAERIATVTQQIHTLVGQGVQVLPVSSHTGQGVQALKALLFALPEQIERRAEEKFRLAIDRVFTLAGAGLVVTGTAFGGRVKVGDTLWLSSNNSTLRVRSIHAMNQSAQEGQAGQRLALNLVGDAQKQDIRRGHWLLAQAQEPTTSIDVQLDLCEGLDKALTHWQSVHLHAAAQHTTARLSLLESSPCTQGSTLARLHLDAPLYVTVGDRMILRDISAQITLAGATVLDPTPPTRGQRKPERLVLLKRLAQSDARGALQAKAEQAGVPLANFAQAYNLPLAQVQTLAKSLNLHLVGKNPAYSMAFLPEHWAALQQSVLSKMAQAHETAPDQAGVSSERLHRLACPALAHEQFTALRDELLERAHLARNGAWLHLPGFALAFSASEQAVWEKLEPNFSDPCNPLWVRDLAQTECLDETSVRELLKKAARMGLVAAIVRDRYLTMHGVSQLAKVLIELAEQEPVITVAQFRDRINVGRKLAVQILEFFDRSGFTRRRQDSHMLRDASLFITSSTKEPR